jgi:putative membrane protein
VSDRGVAPERTDLAWERTGLGVLGVAGLLAHRALISGRTAFLVAAGVAALMGLLVLGRLGPARYRELTAGVAAGTRVVAPRRLGVLTGMVVLTAVVAAAAILTPR